MMSRSRRMVMPATPRLEREYRLRYGWQTAEVEARSSRLLNVNGNPCGDPVQLGYPSIYQGLPADADTLLRWLGGGAYPAGFGIPNVLAIYACDTASPLLDSLGLGPNLVAAGGPLTGRECIGLGQAGSFTSKVGVECPTEGGLYTFADAGNAFMDVADGTVRSFLIVFRVNPSLTIAAGRLFSKELGGAAQPWTLTVAPTNVILWGGVAYGRMAQVNVSINENAWHCAAGVLNAITPGAHTLSLLGDFGDVTTAGFADSLNNGNSLSLGLGAGGCAPFQCAYIACFDLALTTAMRAAFWRHAQPGGFSSAPLNVSRNGPLVCPITASRVASWAGGNSPQVAVGYNAALASAANGNALGTGYLAEAATTFEPIGSDNFYANTNSIFGGAKASVDGPSGMRDGLRTTMNAAWPGAFHYCPNAGVAIVGVSNIPWRMDINYRRATVNTTARAGLRYTGSAAGTEQFTLVSDAASPVDWVRAGGTCTPVNADQNTVYVVTGAAANLDDCDFGEPTLIKNRTYANLGWRRVGTAAAAATGTPTLSMTNTLAEHRYDPIVGEVRLVIAGFQGTAGATFLQYGAAAAAGSLTLDYFGGSLRLRIWDSAAVLAATVMGGPLGTGRYDLSILWSTRAPIIGMTGCYAALVSNTAPTPTLLGFWPTPWTPAVAAVTPLRLGTDAAGANSARCYIERA